MILPLPSAGPPRWPHIERPLRLLFAAVLLLTTITTSLPAHSPATPPLPAPLPASAVPPADTLPAAPAAPIAPAYPLPQALVGRPEVVAARTAGSATFDLGGGRYALLEGGAPLHYRDADDAWQPIDPAFAPVEGGWVNATNTLRTSLAQRSSSAKLVAGNTGTGWQPVALATSAPAQSADLATPLAGGSGAPGTRSRDGRTVRYAHGWSDSNVQDQWHTAPGSSEYALRLASQSVLLNPQSQIANPKSLDLRVQLHLHPGTTIVADGKPIALPFATSGTLVFTSTTGEEIHLLPPAAYEQGNPTQHIAGSYALAGTADASVVELRVRFPWRWLAGSSRQFPVILDPVFQTRTPITARSAVYDSNKTFKGYDDAPPLKLGQFKDETRRLLVKFDMPTMPPGTTLDRAHLLAVPTGAADNDVAGLGGAYTANSIAHGEFQQAQFHAYGLANIDWLGAAAPAFDASAPLNGPFGGVGSGPGPDVVVTFSNHNDGQLSSDWDVTTLAHGWADFWGGGIVNPGDNPGVVLALKDEPCAPDPLRCGGFTFASPSVWQNDELDGTELISTPDDVTNPTSSGSGGLRLVVFYSGPTLAEGQVVKLGDDPFSAARNPSADPPFYHADHEYRLPPLPADHWQAAVVRGFGPQASSPPGTSLPNTRPLQGSLPLQLRDANGKALASTATNGGVGYVVLNGAAQPGAQTSLRVQPPGGSPLGYDVRLIGPTATIAPALGSSQTATYAFDSDTPLALWNVALPNGSNSRVDVTALADPAGAFDPLARQLQAQLFRSSDGVALSPDKPYAALQSNNADSLHLTSPIFTATAAQYALGLRYNGPFVNNVPPPPTPKIRTDGDIAPSVAGPLRLQFKVSVQVTSCPAIDAAGDATFPTAAGTCEKVKCPTSVTFPAGNTNERQSGFFHVWSATGWSGAANPASSVGTSVAPMLGVDTGPTVAVLGGVVTIDGNSASIAAESLGPFASSDIPTVLLVNCGNPANTINPLTGFFSVYNGSLQGDGFDPEGDPRGASLQRVGNGTTELDNLWPAQDQSDLAPISFDIQPHFGRALRRANLTRAAGSGADTATLTFANVNWSLGVDGWPSLGFGTSGGIGAVSGARPTVASLNLALGDRFDLDVEAARDKETPRHVLALRAPDATIAQPAKLGGASKPVQVLILARGTDTTTGLTCTDQNKTLISCIDLRAPDDTPDRPDRTWALPDVHLADRANTVAVSANGALQVYSTDHPKASPNADNISESFSYDTFGAKVSVTQDTCDKDDPTVVTVIKGETKLTLPNIGDSAAGNAAITSAFKICQTSLREVKLAFKSPVGIPIGNSGLFLTGLSGEVDLFPSHTTIIFGIDIQAAAGGDGGLLKVHGDVTIDTRGLFTLQAQGSLLKGVVGIDGNLWVGWTPLDIGFKVQLRYPMNNPWVTGLMRAHMWQGQGWQHRYAWLPDNNDTHVAAEISATITIKQGQIFSWWFLDIPPGDVALGIDLAFGQFCTNDACTTYEWGVKGKLIIAGYDIGVYYGFDHGFDFILGNDSHVLIDQANGATDVPQTQAALSSDGPLTVQAAPPIIKGTALIPITINPGVQSALFGLGWQAGGPQLSLITPDGVEITAANAASNGATIATTLNNTLLGVHAPKPGQWQAKISGLSGAGIEHYKFISFTNHGAPVTDNADIGLIPTVTDENGTTTYHITWRAPAGTPAPATISLFARRTKTIPEAEPTNLDEDVPIVQHLPFTRGAYDWTTTGLANGSYQIAARIDDGVNTIPASVNDDPCSAGSGLPTLHAFDANRFPGTVVVTATGTVTLNDTAPPPPPSGLALTGVDGALLARWDAPTSAKVAAYRVRWGRPSGVSTIVLLDVHEQRVTATSAPTLRLGGLNNGTSYAVQIAALDANGNESALTPFSVATPDGSAASLLEAPSDFTQTQVTATSAAFTWSAGAAAAPAGYRLFYTRLGRTQTSGQLDVATTNGTLSGLQVGATYDVLVAALNGADWSSDRSAPVRIVATSGADGDGDGLPDEWATAYNVHGGNADADSDGRNNAQELAAGTDPTQADSDGDGWSDAEEAAQHTDALDARSFGSALIQPRLALSSDRLVFRPKLQTTDPLPPQRVQWSNVGGGTLSLQATSSQPWLQASVQGDTMQVGLDTSRLTPGFYSGVVRLSAGPGSDPLVSPPACIRVNAWVSPPDSGFTYTTWLPLVVRR